MHHMGKQIPTEPYINLYLNIQKIAMRTQSQTYMINFLLCSQNDFVSYS